MYISRFTTTHTAQGITNSHSYSKSIHNRFRIVSEVEPLSPEPMLTLHGQDVCTQTPLNSTSSNGAPSPKSALCLHSPSHCASAHFAQKFIVCAYER